MPVTLDALNIATEHLLPKLENLFFDDHPWLARIILNGIDRRPSGGEYAAFVVTTDGPGNIVKLLTGSEAYAYGRRNITQQARVFIGTHLYTFAVEGEALRHSDGETGIANLLQVYPEAGMLDFRQRAVGQNLTGNGAAANADGWVTVNGDQTYNPDGTALSGVLDFATPAAQTDTVFNLPKQGAANGVTGWYNQYGNVLSFGSSGKRIMRDVYNACHIRSGTWNSPPDLGLTDSTSYNNYYESLDDNVRYATTLKGEDGATGRDGLMFHKLELFIEPSIDDNLTFFGHGTNGTTYMFNTKTWFILTLGQDASKETKGFFEVRPPFKLQGRDAWGYEIVCAWQIGCRYLKANGCLEGTAII